MTVETESVNANKKTPSYGGKKGAAMMALPPEALERIAGQGGQYVKIPSKYANPQGSGLTTTLKAGDNTYDINLTD